MCIIGSILYMYVCVRGRETKKEKGMLRVIMTDTWTYGMFIYSPFIYK